MQYCRTCDFSPLTLAPKGCTRLYSVCTKPHLLASSLLSKLSSIFPLQTMLFSRYFVSVLHTSELQPVDNLSAAWLWCLLWASHDALAYKNSVHKRLQVSTVTFSCIVIPLKTAFFIKPCSMLPHTEVPRPFLKPCVTKVGSV